MKSIRRKGRLSQQTQQVEVRLVPTMRAELCQLYAGRQHLAPLII